MAKGPSLDRADGALRRVGGVALEDEQLEVLHGLELPLVTVPFLVEGIDPNAVAEISEMLIAQGVLA